MKAKYQLVRTTDFNGEQENQPLYARLVPHGTVSITQMMEWGKEYSTFSQADIKGALQLISELLEKGLRQGYNVELDGIGYFTVTLCSRPVMEKDEIRSPSVNFKQVNYRINKEMKRRLKAMPLIRDDKTARKTFTSEERETRLWRYLEQHPDISSQKYMYLNDCTKYRALADLNQLIKDGKLRKRGYKASTLYMK